MSLHVSRDQNRLVLDDVRYVFRPREPGDAVHYYPHHVGMPFRFENPCYGCPLKALRCKQNPRSMPCRPSRRKDKKTGTWRKIK